MKTHLLNPHFNQSSQPLLLIKQEWSNEGSLISPLRLMSFSIFLALAIIGCDDSKQRGQTDNSANASRSTSTSSDNKPDSSIYKSLTFAYSYDGKLAAYDIADTAVAYDGGTVVARASSTNLQDVEGTTHIEVEEMHFDKTTGAETYRGTLLFSIAVDGRAVSETRKSGRKYATVFRRWPWGHATYKVRIDYTHNGTVPGGYYALADGAKAYDMSGTLIAEATPIRVVKEDEFVLEVEEVHYLGAQGAENYRGILRFFTNSGHLVGEIPKSGTKQRVVFADWP